MSKKLRWALPALAFSILLLGCPPAVSTSADNTGTVADPSFSPAGGSFASDQSVTVSDATAGAAIYYTVDGSTPTASSTLYTGPISVVGPATTKTIRAIATDAGMTSSAVAAATYVIAALVATPTFSPAAGTYTTDQSVTVSDATSGAAIYYTTDGSTPSTSSTLYTGPISVVGPATTKTIRAIATKAGMTSSTVAAATYIIAAIVATPTFSPAAGTYTSDQSVTVSDATSGAAIYYTTDGSTPSTSSTLYTGPISVVGPATTKTIRAIATDAGMTSSTVAAATYVIAAPVATPTFSPAAGTYTSDQSVTVSDATSGAAIYYTTDGSTPSTSSTLYTGPISVVGPATTKTIRAIATKAGMTSSAVASATYVIAPIVATPTFNPAAGTYTTDQSVTVSDATAGASIYYTLDGSTPSASSTLYAGPISVNGPATTKTIRAIATKAGMTSSAVAAATYVIAAFVATPTFSPAAGTYTSDQSVTVSDATSGAAIYYTTDGSTPSTSSTLYAGPISVNGPATTKTIRAIATKAGMTSSAIAAATYVVATPFAWTDVTPSGGAHGQYWWSIVSSSDGSHLAATVESGDIWASADYGATWTNQTTGTAASGLEWTYLVSSSDGSHLFATTGGDDPGDLWTSSDYGATWIDRTPSGATHTQMWSGLASSADGARLAAINYNHGNGGNIWTSTDSGASWTNRTPTALDTWREIASSADGKYLAVAGQYNGASMSLGDLWTSSDYGVTWTDRTATGAAHQQAFQAIVSSADGSHLAAITSADIWTSADYGATWIDRTATGPAHGLSWLSIASSSDGSHLAAGNDYGTVWVSTDYGATWTNTVTGPASGNGWAGVALTADGSRMAAVVGGGDIWIRAQVP